jgi:signal transduction histidine kinase
MKLTTFYYRHIVPAVMVLFVAVIVSAYFLIRHALQRELDIGLLRSKSRIESYVRVNGRLPEVSSFDDQHIQFIRSGAAAGALAAAGSVAGAGSLAAAAADSFSNTMLYIPEQQKEHISRKLRFSLLLDGQQWVVTVSQPLEGTRHITILVVEITVVTILMTLFFFILVNRRVLSKVWRPFYRSLELIGSFKVDDRAEPEYPETDVEEFRLMNVHFRKAAENASKDYRNLREFSENASHELQTPLAIMRSNLDLLLQEGMTERQSELMQGVYAAVRRMKRLQESLLLLTKIDNRQFNGIDDIRIDLVVSDKVQELQELLYARSLHCRLDLVEASVPTNRELLDILLNNLFSNAIRHNIRDGEIHARLEPHCLRVSNTGMAEALDESRVFRRFYKRSGQTDNNGLGLSIIKQICDTTAMKVQYAFAEGWHSFTISW